MINNFNTHLWHAWMPKSSKQLMFYKSIKDWKDLKIFENMKKIEKDRYFEWCNRTVNMTKAKIFGCSLINYSYSSNITGALN